MSEVLNYIGGRCIPAQGGATLDNIAPATGRSYGTLPSSDERDIEAAVAAAHAAAPAWSRTPVAERAALLNRIADYIERDLEALARAESIDTGKPLRLARIMDVPRAAANFRFFAGAAVHWKSEMHRTELPMEGPHRFTALNYTLRQPIGIVGLISPWNLPLYLLSWKIAPAIATGNTCICKPSELTPMTAHLLARLCAEAGVPPGVINIVHGLGSRAGAALVAHPGVPAISFTGGTATGETLTRIAAPMFKKLSLELGGKNATVIFDDADLEAAVPQAVRAAFTNQGQVCLCGSRIFVARSIAAEFKRRFVEQVDALRLGDPLDESTDQGALVSASHLDKVRSYIDLGLAEGGRIINESARRTPVLPERCASGYFHPPVVFENLALRCRLQQEEVFGPVVTITPFDSEDEAASMADSTKYGLMTSIWTRDAARAHRFAERLHVGMVWINCWLIRDLRVPFGGMKASGVGREGGEDALRFFTESKNICLKYDLDSST